MDGNRSGAADYRLAFIRVDLAVRLRYRISIATRNVVFGADRDLHRCVLSGQLADIRAGNCISIDAADAERPVQHALDDASADWAVFLRHHAVPMDAQASWAVR